MHKGKFSILICYLDYTYRPVCVVMAVYQSETRTRHLQIFSHLKILSGFEICTCSVFLADPNFYSMNHVMLAQTYLKLNDKVLAKEHMIKARDLPVRSPDDRQAHAESIQLLNDL